MLTLLNLVFIKVTQETCFKVLLTILNLVRVSGPGRRSMFKVCGDRDVGRIVDETERTVEGTGRVGLNI